MTITLLQVVCVVLAALAAYFAAKWLFRKDTEVEARRRQAVELSAKLTAMGFKSMAELFMDYAVGDYSGMFAKMAMVVEKLKGNDKDILADMSDVFDNLLKMKLAVREGRALVREELESVERMLEPVVPVAPVAPVAPVIPTNPPITLALQTPNVTLEDALKAVKAVEAS
jgi:hypothetical protein